MAINLRMLKTLVMAFLVFKPEFSQRLSRIFFSASSWLSRNFRGRLAGLAQIAAGGRLSRRLRGLRAHVDRATPFAGIRRGRAFRLLDFARARPVVVPQLYINGCQFDF